MMQSVLTSAELYGFQHKVEAPVGSEVTMPANGVVESLDYCHECGCFAYLGNDLCVECWDGDTHDVEYIKSFRLEPLKDRRA